LIDAEYGLPEEERDMPLAQVTLLSAMSNAESYH
jgi:hypothetical protein